MISRSNFAQKANSKAPVLFLVTNSLTGGGAERAMNILANTLHDLGRPVIVVPINKSSKDLIEVKCRVLKPRRKWKSGILITFVSFLDFQVKVLRFRPKILILNCDLPELFGAFCIGNFKIIGVEHASQPWPKRQPLGKIVRRILVKRGASWVKVSNHLSVWSLPYVAAEAIPNSLILNSDLNSSIFFPSLPKRLVFIGRLSEEKDPIFFLRCLKAVNLKGLVIGDGPLLKEMKDLVAIWDLNVEFLGFIRDPWGNIESSDVILVTSRNEGDGLVVLEALNNKIPFILRQVPDLQRFNFSSIVYFSTLIELSDKFAVLVEQSSVAMIDGKVRSNLLAPRQNLEIAKKWNEFLSKTSS
jgi:glycosyltransferase involved in cell wall biosynthesis